MTLKDPFQLELFYNSVTPHSASSLALAPRWAGCGKPKSRWSCPHLKGFWRVMSRRQGPAWPTPHPHPSPAVPWHTPGSPGIRRCHKGIPVQRRVQTPCGRSHKAAHTTQPWAGQQREALPSIAKANPHLRLVVMASLPGLREFGYEKPTRKHRVSGCQERASPSFSGYKDNCQAAPSLLSALGKALPWEYQVGRLVLF